MNWSRVLETAPWRARDSQASVVHDGRMWLMGGWFDSYQPCPRDVWSSPDGITWHEVLREAPWIHSDLPMCVAFQGRMWVMGGWAGGRLPGNGASNQVWHSTDGVDWKMATGSAGWTPRLGSGAVTFKDKMWILGGVEHYYEGDDNSLRNDVWSSPDGVNWKQVTANAGWSPRAFHQAVVFDDHIWIMGGGNYLPNHFACNDVWRSPDGEHWTRVTESAAWDPRLWFRAVVHRDRMWVLGGWAKAKDNFGDVWHSRDGRDWQPLVTTDMWKSRHEHSAWVFNDRIWIAAGHARPLSSEVWTLTEDEP